MLTDALLSESGRSLLHPQVTDFDAKPTFAGDAPLYRFCPKAAAAIAASIYPPLSQPAE